MLSEALGESISENQDEIGQVHISTTKKNDSSMFGSKAQILPDFFDEVKDVAKRVETKATNAKNSRWSLEEKQRLMETVMKNRTSLRGTIDWEVVEREFPNRTRYACKAILKQMERSNETDSNMTNNKISFTKREKTLLTDAVRRLGDRNWAALAKEMSRDTGITRSPVVYNRMWTHKLSPKVQAAPLWSTNDTKRLRELSSIHGKDAVFLTFKFFPQYTPPLISTMLLRMGTKYEDRDPRRTVQLPKDRQRN
ncbi:hypothetical protein COEREDRAFT_86893 [Coemansia reversa NRRL 1564]|uniref:Myb-like domain-containing protein n=1 Tax=Coemansia reversa (strain ATCC 12441 / NRRL 1564) TaxID=763665 RepID=A0A2G5BBU7_COERN|nr:hypothetical protein COEREDRAFT_86893 [Coemansia reversa NRRL 1564]|eukprot:PIA16494.1 hypothetical protein COEREDRAFT_86893 [Coemansia reversa NRRL 1564]